MGNVLHIALSSDSNYVEFVSVLITSIFDNNPEFERINIHLLSYNIPSNLIDVIRNHIPDNKGKIFVYDVSDITKRLKISVPDSISIAAYSRLFLGSLFPDNIKKVIYMDSDSILIDSLWNVWNMDMNKNYVAGVLDDVSDYAKKAIGLSRDSIYINSGFLLIDLYLWRKEKVEERIIQFLIEHKGIVYHHDQGLINVICDKRKLVLPINYNMVTNFFVFPYANFKRKIPFYTESEYLEGRINPVFLHFTAGVANRPWMKNCKHPLQKMFLKYKHLSLFKDKPMRNDDRKLSLRLLSFLYYRFPFMYYSVLKVRNFLLREY